VTLSRRLRDSTGLQAVRRELGWLAANALALMGFCIVAPPAWIASAPGRVPGARGGAAAVGASTALPVIAGAFALDLIWFGFAIARAARRGDPKPAAAAFSMVAVWVIIVLYDSARRGA
jgi:hypothetical protein